MTRPHRIPQLALAGLVATALILVHSAPAWPQSVGGLVPGDLLVTNLDGNSVSRFDGTTGQYLGDFVGAASGGLRGATGLAFGRGGSLYVGSSGTHQILIYDGKTGAYQGVFAEGGVLASPFSMTLAPGGDLYVSSGPRVLRYDPAGDVVGEIVIEAGERPLPIGLRFGPDGMLYVAASSANAVLVFDPESGELLRTLRPDGLEFPSDIAFDNAGTLWVSSAFTGSVHGLDVATGAETAPAIQLPEGGVPVGLVADAAGRLLIVDFGAGRLFRWAAGDTAPELLSTEGLSGPENIAVAPAEMRP